MSEPYHTFEPGEDPEREHSRLTWVALGGLAYWIVRKWRRRRPAAAEIDEETVRRGHQPVDEVSVKGIVGFAAALLVMLLLVLGGAAMLIGVFEVMEEPRSRSPFVEQDGRPAEHPLQADPSVELKEVREREERLLNTYAWIDSSRGIARIPLEDAMDRLAGRSDTVAADSVRLLTESGYVVELLRVPAPAASAYDVGAPEDFAVSPEIARILGIITTQEERQPPE